MNIRFNYDTYQDVRNNLFIYTTPFFIFAGFLSFFFILPEAHQQKIVKLLDCVSNSQPWKNIFWGTSAGLVLFTVIAFFFTEILKVHDKWYDRLIIRWRHRYDTGFILPRLVQPFGSNLNYRFYESVETHTREYQEQLFYPFVNDRDVKIPKNKVIRFYEVVTVYWLTQINEIIILFLGCCVVIYRFVGPADIVYRTTLLNVCLGLAFFFLLNRYWIRCSLTEVKKATEEEIRAIHEDKRLLDELKVRLIKLCRDYNIPYCKGDQYKNTI